MARPRKRITDEKDPNYRLVLPKGRQVLGIVETRLGYGKSRVICTDGNTRICRIPGARRRDLWIRPGNVVLVEPWEAQGDTSGDIIFQYTPPEVQRLKRKGLLKDLLEKSEF